MIYIIYMTCDMIYVAMFIYIHIFIHIFDILYTHTKKIDFVSSIAPGFATACFQQTALAQAASTEL